MENYKENVKGWKAAIDATGMGVYEFAALADITPACLYQIFQGKREASIGTYFKVQGKLEELKKSHD